MNYSLTTLISGTRLQCDMVKDQSIDDTGFTQLINDAAAELYDEITTTWGTNYYMRTPVTFSVQTGVSQYPLPDGDPSGSFPGSPEYYKCLGVDAQFPGMSGEQSWISLRENNFGDRNRMTTALTFQNLSRPIDTQFRVDSTDPPLLTLTSLPPAGTVIRVWYAAALTPLVSGTDTLPWLAPGWQQFIYLKAGALAKAKSNDPMAEDLEAKAERRLSRIKKAVPRRVVTVAPGPVDVMGPGYGGFGNTGPFGGFNY